MLVAPLLQRLVSELMGTASRSMSKVLTTHSLQVRSCGPSPLAAKLPPFSFRCPNMCKSQGLEAEDIATEAVHLPNKSLKILGGPFKASSRPRIRCWCLWCSRGCTRRRGSLPLLPSFQFPRLGPGRLGRRLSFANKLPHLSKPYK